ncbi:MAG: endonuclease III [Candidatus Omnitrophica bacterium]|nr:endonuclease III [Candidatus Omnitrophota bacterium]
MAREPKEALKKRTLKIIRLLKKAYPDAKCALAHRSPLELLVATILSAQCTDKRVNLVTKDLFRKYRSADDYANASRAEFEQDIRSTGFYRNKAKNIIACCKAIVSEHGGKIPETLEELVKLSGIGRKTANVVLGNAFNTPGLVVDTHVRRISRKLKLTGKADPVKIEFDLMPIVPKEEWTQFSHLLIHHGRACCVARRPKCSECPVEELCPSSAA